MLLVAALVAAVADIGGVEDGAAMDCILCVVNVVEEAADRVVAPVAVAVDAFEPEPVCAVDFWELVALVPVAEVARERFGSCPGNVSLGSVCPI